MRYDLLDQHWRAGLDVPMTFDLILLAHLSFHQDPDRRVRLVKQAHGIGARSDAFAGCALGGVPR
jgi:hypothetical protein